MTERNPDRLTPVDLIGIMIAIGLIVWLLLFTVGTMDITQQAVQTLQPIVQHDPYR